MRRIVAFDHVSADGHFAAADGNLDWVVQDDAVSRSLMEGARFDAMLFGRRTYELFEAFWPQALDGSDTAPDPHAPGRRSKDVHAMAVFINQQEKLVFSRGRSAFDWPNTRPLPVLDRKVVEGLRHEPGGDIIVFGSGSVVAQLTELGLVNEYQLVVSPVLLGDGRSLVTGLGRKIDLKTIEAKAFPSGSVLLRFAPA
ncbi:MAG: dihydrofolate reductase family protein [Vicinamibacteria bacterium]